MDRHQTSATHISVEMFDFILNQKYGELGTRTETDKAQAGHLFEITRASREFPTLLAEVLDLARSRPSSKEMVAQIALMIGIQTGYELGVAYPPNYESEDPL